jgi:hypothetical protein
MTVRVLCDAIHADLWESLRILFEDRFGWELWRPIGMEWYESGLWRFERDRLGDVVAKQFLEPWDTDRALMLTAVTMEDYVAGGASLRADTTHPPRDIKLVTYEAAQDVKWDIVLSTLAENDPGLAGFAERNGAHFGVQVGNQGALVAWPLAEFAMLSVTTPGFTPWRPHVYYRQEFDLGLFHADGGALADPDWVMTRVQCAQNTPEHATFRELAARTPDLRWTYHGHCGERDEHFGGDAPTTAQVADEMHRARIAWHAKRWSDGYGHVIHNWAAIGRPMLVTATYYADKLAAPLFVEGETSFNLEAHSTDELEAIIRRLVTDEDHYRRICENAARRFREVVDFDAEAASIKAMLEAVLS